MTVFTGIALLVAFLIVVALIVRGQSPIIMLLILAIVSVQRTPEATRITGNIRAPLIVDVVEKVALQYVFPNSQYQISHPLS